MPDATLTIAFVDNIGHRAMAALVRDGFLWCRDTVHNRANAQAIWTTAKPSQLSLADDLPDTPEGLATALDDALVHHPSICTIVIHGFTDLNCSDIEMSGRGFAVTKMPFVYRRIPSL